jgi:hypothetical protein
MFTPPSKGPLINFNMSPPPFSNVSLRKATVSTVANQGPPPNLSESFNRRIGFQYGIKEVLFDFK